MSKTVYHVNLERLLILLVQTVRNRLQDNS